MEEKHLKAALEAMLFAHGDAVSAQRLAEVLETSKETVERCLAEMQLEYDKETRGITLIRVEDRWQLSTKNAYGALVRAVLDKSRNTPLSQAALEVLAVIAYNQPVSRSFVEQVRGVDSTAVIHTLLQRGLIEEAGRMDLPGKPLAFATTDAFLRVFGLENLGQLPPLHGQEASAGE